MKQEKKKRAVSFILSLLLMVVAVPANPIMARTETVDESDVASGICGAEGNGENVRWEYDGNGILTLSGTGAVASNALTERILPYINTTSLLPGLLSFRNIRVGEGITRLKSNSLVYYGTKKIELPSTITEIEGKALTSAVLYGKSDYAREYAENREISYVDATMTYDLSDAWFYIPSYEYTGSEIRPVPGESTADMYEAAPFVSYNGVTLYQGLDYSIAYENNIECGEAKAVLTGLGNYTGTKETSFSICEELITDGRVEITYENKPELYEEAVDTNPKTVVTYEGKTLTEGVDYVVKIERKYISGDREGEPDVLAIYIHVYGKGRYRMQTTDILYWRQDIENTHVSLEYDRIPYDGSPKKPNVTVTTLKGKVLEETIDYTLRYENNINPGEATVRIIGKGAYRGTDREAVFHIDGLSINGAAISLNEAIFTYDGSPKRPSVKVTLNGKLLTAGKDYSVSYSGNINPGTAYVTVTGNGIYAGSVKTGFKILPYSSGKDSVYDKENTFIDGDYIYEVTDDEQKEVELSGTANKNLTKAAVPLEAVGNGTKYKVTSIGEKAFYKNAKLKSVTVASNVTSIENYAFYGCKNVTSIKLGKNVELIGDSSFRKCTKLKFVTLPKKMEELGKNAFYGCKKLKTITIQANGVVSIGKNALKGISKTAVIKVPTKQVKKYQKQVKANTGFKKSMKIKKK